MNDHPNQALSRSLPIQPLPQIDMDADSEPVIPLQNYLYAILKRFWTVFFIFSIVVGLAAVYTLRQPKIFEAKTSLVVDMSRQQVLGSEVQPVVELSAADTWNTSQYFETQYRIIKSRMLAAKVVDKLGLADDPVFLQIDGIKDPQKFEKKLRAIDPVEHLRSLISIDPAIDSRIVSIRIRHTDPKLAARLTNEIAQIYQQQNVDQKLESTYGAYNWLTGQHKEIKEKLEESDRALFRFKKDNGILSTSLKDKQNIIAQRLVDLNRQLTDVRAERIRRGAEVGQVKKLRNRDLSRASFDEVLTNPLVQNLKSTLGQLKQKEAELSERYLENHPEMIAVRNQIGAVERNLNREIRTVLETAENRLAVIQRTEGGLQEELAKTKKEALELNQKELDYNKLARENENNERLYELVLRRLKETDLSRLLRDNNIRILDRALVPDKPVLPILPLNLALGAILGLISGIGMAFILELFDNSVKTQEDIEGYIGLTFLGLIPRMSIEEHTSTVEGMDEFAKDLFVHAFPRSPVSECYRTVRTNLLFMSPDRHLNRILITSSGPREGKTLISANIASAMAQSNTRILLVDTDMRRPRIHKLFKGDNRVGLSSLLLGEASYEEAIRPSPVPNLDYLPCGPIPPNPSELIHTARFLEVMRDLDERYDRVIYDSPPTIAVTDSMILSNLVDGVIFVVRAGDTSKEIVRQATSRLKAVNAPLLGAILNDVDLKDRKYGMSNYYYYKKYGQYYQADEEEDFFDAHDDSKDAA